MGESATDTPLSERPSERLESWKEIAVYLGRDVTTVQRWEKRERMPVHRHLHDKRGSVYALAPELDQWLQGRRVQLTEPKEELGPEQKTEAPAEPQIDRGASAAQPVRRGIALAGVGVLTLLALALLLFRGRPAIAPSPKIGSLAVLPLKNLTGDPTQEYLADGMTEALIGRLSRMHGLHVISRTSVMRFKNSQISAPEIARMLRVDALVEGSVMRENNRIRVTVQLIRGSTDEHFWSETYDRELRDVLTVQSELAQAIARKVAVSVTGEEHDRLAAARSVAPEVYESYLKGRYVLGKSDSRAGLAESVAYFQRAIQMDPTFAPA